MKKVLKWLLILVVVVLVAGAGFAAYCHFKFRSALSEVHEVKPSGIELPTDEAMIKEGRRLFLARGCATCHGDNAGGLNVAKKEKMPDSFGELYGPNLTRGKGGAWNTMKVKDFVRAIRNGIKPDGTSLVVMPSRVYYYLSDRDVGAIIAYLKSTKPVDKKWPPSDPALLAKILYVVAGFPLIAADGIDHSAPRPKAPPVRKSVAFGKYLAVACRDCHGKTLSGGKIPGAPDSIPVPTNITFDKATGLGKWSKEQFFTLLKTGKRPDGTKVDRFMPWRELKHCTPTELESLWLYLKSMPKKPFGGR